MKTKHLLLAVALVVAVAACSAEITEPHARPFGPSTEVAPTAAPDTVTRDGGLLGSGGGK